MLPHLTGLRFIAAFLVVLLHYRQWLHLSAPLDHFVSQGASGVSFFFVLSGVVLTWSYQHWFAQGTMSRMGEYLRARVARIYPMYLLALLLVTAVVGYGLTHGLTTDRGYHADAALAGSWVLNALLLQTWVPVRVVEDAFNGPAWSLSCEAFFYLLFPWIAARMVRLGSPAALLRLGLGLFAIEAAAVLGTFVFVRLGHLPDILLDYVIYRHPLLRVWEFALGCTIGAYLTGVRTGRWPLARPLATAAGRTRVTLGAALLALPVIALPEHLLEVPRWYLAYTPTFAVMILALGSGVTLFSRVLDHPWVVRLGQASFSLYILHWAGVLALQFAQMAGVTVTRPMAWAGILLSVLVSVLAWRKIEEPLNRVIRKAPQRAVSISTRSAP